MQVEERANNAALQDELVVANAELRALRADLEVRAGAGSREGLRLGFGFVCISGLLAGVVCCGARLLVTDPLATRTAGKQGGLQVSDCESDEGGCNGRPPT